jgi:hypothetical protein
MPGIPASGVERVELFARRARCSCRDIRHEIAVLREAVTMSQKMTPVAGRGRASAITADGLIEIEFANVEPLPFDVATRGQGKTLESFLSEFPLLL